MNFIGHYHFALTSCGYSIESISTRTLIEQDYGNVVLDHIIAFNYHSNTWKRSCDIPHHHSASTSYQSKLVSLFTGCGRYYFNGCFYSAPFRLPDSWLQPFNGDPTFGFILRGSFCYEHTGFHRGSLLRNSPSSQVHTHYNDEDDHSSSCVSLVGTVNSRCYSNTCVVKSRYPTAYKHGDFSNNTLYFFSDSNKKNYQNSKQPFQAHFGYIEATEVQPSLPTTARKIRRFIYSLD